MQHGISGESCKASRPNSPFVVVLASRRAQHFEHMLVIDVSYTILFIFSLLPFQSILTQLVLSEIIAEQKKMYILLF